METIREIIFSREFDEFYHNLDERIQEKYDYVFDMIRTQYIANKKFVISLENTDFYELRISIGHNEYRSIMLAIDHDNFIQAHRVLVGQSENSVAILLSGYSFVSLRHETMASITDSIS